MTERDLHNNVHIQRCASTACPCYMDGVGRGVTAEADLAEARTIMRDAADFLDSYSDDSDLGRSSPTLLLIMRNYAADLRSQLPDHIGATVNPSDSTPNGHQ